MNEPLSIEVSDLAKAQIRVAEEWWRANRPAAPNALEQHATRKKPELPRCIGVEWIVKTFDVLRALTLAGLAAVPGCAYVWWLRAPVVDTVGLQAWRAVGLIAAASIGGIGVLTTRSWVGVSIALSIGLLAGATWSESWLNGVSTGLMDSFVAAVVNHGRPFLLPCIAAGLAGAFAIRVVLRTPAASVRRQ